MLLKILIICCLVSIYLLGSPKPSVIKSSFKNSFYGPAKEIIKNLQEFNVKFVQKEESDSLNSFFVDSTTMDKKLPNSEQNKIIKDDESGMPMLIGECTRDVFKDTSFYWWWMSEYDLYKIDSTSLNEIKNDLNNINIKIVMGTWCSDSRREVPRFFKILDEVNYPSDKVEIICVDEDKKAEGNELSGLKIELVPTIIFFKDGNELGRIVEAPENTLERDMIKILIAQVKQ